MHDRLTVFHSIWQVDLWVRCRQEGLCQQPISNHCHFHLTKISQILPLCHSNLTPFQRQLRGKPQISINYCRLPEYYAMIIVPLLPVMNPRNLDKKQVFCGKIIEIRSIRYSKIVDMRRKLCALSSKSRIIRLKKKRYSAGTPTGALRVPAERSRNA